MSVHGTGGGRGGQYLVLVVCHGTREDTNGPGHQLGSLFQGQDVAQGLRVGVELGLRRVCALIPLRPITTI